MAYVRTIQRVFAAGGELEPGLPSQGKAFADDSLGVAIQAAGGDPYKNCSLVWTFDGYCELATQQFRNRDLCLCGYGGGYWTLELT